MTIENQDLHGEFIVEAGGVQKMRLGVGMTLFLPRPFELAREGVHALWQQYLKLVGSERLTWMRLGGGNRSRKATPATLRTVESWLTGKTSYGDDCWIIASDGALDELGTTCFELEGLNGDVNDGGYATGFVQIDLPLALLDSLGAEGLADTFATMAGSVPYLNGTAGYVFQRSPFAFDRVVPRMAALAARFQGVEVTGNVRMRYWAPLGVPSINWMTFVGDAFASKVGGVEALGAALPRCKVKALQHGVVIQAGNTPVLADKHELHDELASWRDVNRILAPVRYISPRARFDSQFFDNEKTTSWLNRLNPA